MLLLLLCTCLPAATAEAGSGSGDAWLYADARHDGGERASAAVQRRTWADYDDCAHGRTQSPIDIVSAAALPDAALAGAVTPAIRANAVRPTTTHHSFQLFQTSPELATVGDAEAVAVEEGGREVQSAALRAPKGTTLLRGELYNFYQIHWHAPSENTIDGEYAALEGHLVHQLAEAEYVGSNSHLAVVAVHYDLSPQCNVELDAFWALFPRDAAATSPNATVVDVQAMLRPLLAGGVYHWVGSLTTPPCTPGVSWYLLKERPPVCQRQIDRLKAALASVQRGVAINNRVTQPLHQRAVTVTPPPCALLCGAMQSVLLFLLLVSIATLGAGAALSRWRRGISRHATWTTRQHRTRDALADIELDDGGRFQRRLR